MTCSTCDQNKGCCLPVIEPAFSFKIGLVGNPNSGKTTLFNGLTGGFQKVGNWPGVTVERKSGLLKGFRTIEVIDLPGVYSVNSVKESGSIDERIASEFIASGEADLYINVVDANHLERHLYLTLQLLENNVPVILALNMTDVALLNGKTILLEQLSQAIGCPVVSLEAVRGKGLAQLQKLIVERALKVTTENAKILRSAQDDNSIAQDDSLHLKTAQQRYQFIDQLIPIVISKTSHKTSITERIDKIVLNRILGIPIFLSVMYCLFFFAINIGGAFQDFFDISSNTIFVEGFAQFLGRIHTPAWLIALLAEGVGKGINTTITFIPVIGAMFLFLALLEDSGYMARAAFVVDRLMQMLGLPGKSFVPMIIGFGCNVPSVMAARTLENKRDRILTIMMSPFMSCGARLAIYAIFTAAFFPQGGQNVVFGLYLIGIVMAVLTGLLLRKTVLKGDAAPLLMEMPDYHLPHFKSIFLHAWQRLKGFVFRAGKLIIPICILIGALNAINIGGNMTTLDANSESILSFIGKTLTPIFSPMGISQSNWPATVGLLTGVLAKEVVIGTLNTLYAQSAHIALDPNTAFNVWTNLQIAFATIPNNLLNLMNSFSNPILAQAPIHTLSQPIYGMMYQEFNGQIAAFAYLLFVLLYFPCVSTVAAMAKELNRGWAIFSMVWSTLLAYLVAVGFYQIATFTENPKTSSFWLGCILFSIILTITIMKKSSSYPLADN